MPPAAHPIAAMSVAVTLLIALGACSRSQPEQTAEPATAAATAASATVAATPKTAPAAQQRAALMQAVFKDGYRPAKDNALADLPDPDSRNRKLRMLLTPLTFTKLPTGELALAVNGEVADKDGEAIAGHASPGMLSMYLLRDNAGVWEVTSRHENVAAMGSSGKVGTARWVKQTNGLQLLAVEGGGTWQGYTLTSLDLFDPSAGQVRSLIQEGLRIYSGNEGACGPETAHCWEINARWHLAPSTNGAKYDDLVMVFSGHEEKAIDTKPADYRDAYGGGDEEAPADAEAEAKAEPKSAATVVQRERKKVASTARYQFERGGYRLKSGANPVPEV